MFVYLCYRPEFTFIYKPGPKQEFDEREPPRDHYKGIETVTPTRDKPLAVLRQVKTPLVSKLCFQCIISEGNDLDTLLLGILLLEFLLLVMLTLIRIRWCPPAFFTVELLFSLYY